MASKIQSAPLHVGRVPSQAVRLIVFSELIRNRTGKFKGYLLLVSNEARNASL